MPLGARIVYPPDPLEPIAHPERAIKRAIAKPLEDDRSSRSCDEDEADDRLRRSVVAAASMAAPDVRQLVMEEVIDMAAEAGIDDLHIIRGAGPAPENDRGRAASHRRPSASLRRFIRPPLPARRRRPENNVYVGKTAQNEEVTLNRRAAESTRHLREPDPGPDGRRPQVDATGLASFRSIAAHHNAKTLLASRSYITRPTRRCTTHASGRAKLIEDTVRVFHIETTVNNHAFPAVANFMQKRETDWTPQDQAMFLATKQMTDIMPPAFKRSVFHAMRAPYE